MVYSLYVFVTAALFTIIQKNRIGEASVQFFWKWGNLIEKEIKIPYSEILKIDLVEYHGDEYSTIYFTTRTTYNMIKMDPDTGLPRHCCTFEKVKNGKEAYQILMDLWSKKRKTPSDKQLN